MITSSVSYHSSLDGEEWIDARSSRFNPINKPQQEKAGLSSEAVWSGSKRERVPISTGIKPGYQLRHPIWQ
jgi:hypothetical protein